ncbi:MAG TPA: hypothetical protein VMM36_01605 [Opitutaceae bacterium]|nr:hypothetical protein [Opitutaceae bacterium]
MKKLIAVLALAISAAGLAAQVPDAPIPSLPNGLGLGVMNENVDLSRAPAEVQTLVVQIREQRQAFLQERRALIEGLKDLSEEERAARIEELRIQSQEAAEAVRELAKSIREQLRTLRDLRRNPGA